MPARTIVTTSPELRSWALRELRVIAPDLRVAREFAAGVFMVATDTDGRTFSDALVRADPVFVKHAMPVQAEADLTGRRETDLPLILDRARQAATLAPGERFCVQCRRVGPGFDYDAKDVEVCVGSHFEGQGSVPVFSDTAVAAEESLKVISVYLFRDKGYVGFSTVGQNLNEHCDEYRVFSRHGRTVSRAEYKLIEALRRFRVTVPSGRALDLGAAPGGWTRVLADAGMNVVAVDPADLDPSVIALPGVTHARVRAEDYVSDGGFDLLASDMNVDPEQSAAAMVTMARHLRPGAPAIMTVKLVIRNAARLLDNIRPILAPAYDVVRIKCLFHNRREVTVLLRRK